MAVLGSTVAMGIASTAGVASIMPLMAVVADPGIIEENRWLSLAYQALGLSSTRTFLFLLGLFTLAFIALSNGVSAFNAWLSARFQWGLNHTLSCRLFEKYLAQSYPYFLSRNTSHLGQNVLQEVMFAVNGVVWPMVRLIAHWIVTLFIFALLLWVDVKLALLVVVVTGVFYGGIYALVRRRQAALGRERVTANTGRFRITTEAFGGIKDVKVLGREAHFLDAFQEPSRSFARTQASNTIIGQVPRYALETVAFGCILLIVLYLLGTYEDLGRVLPVVTLYAFAAYRLMPAVQGIFSALAQIRFNVAALDDLYEHLVGDRLEPQREALPALRPSAARERRDADAVPFEREIRLEGVGFSYEGAPAPVLQDVSLVIPRNSSLGVVGHTGSGKTTLIDLLLGLFEPTEGRILVDGRPITGERLFAWRRRIGYVPQHIFLADRSVKANIAFGVAEEEIDDERVLRAGRVAQLDSFVRTLPDGYETVVGERGVRLSGGQLQRVGIARALYDDPEVIVMDEATSALDSVTEEAVMGAIRRLAGRKTMILVAHRLSTVEHCDSLVVMKEGRIASQGSYRQLLDQDAELRALARATGK